VLNATNNFAFFEGLLILKLDIKRNEVNAIKAEYI
jgi:hypothetical protein